MHVHAVLDNAYDFKFLHYTQDEWFCNEINITGRPKELVSSWNTYSFIAKRHGIVISQ